MIGKYLECSTEHLTSATLDYLDEAWKFENGPTASGIVIYPKLVDNNDPEEGCYGYLIVVVNPELYPDSYEGFEDEPEDLQELILFAARNGCDWINLDGDGDVIDGLPLYVGNYKEREALV